MSRMTAKMSAAALLALGALVVQPAVGRAQDQTAPKPPETPAATAPAPAAPTPAVTPAEPKPTAVTPAEASPTAAAPAEAAPAAAAPEAPKPTEAPKAAVPAAPAAPEPAKAEPAAPAAPAQAPTPAPATATPAAPAPAPATAAPSTPTAPPAATAPAEDKAAAPELLPEEVELAERPVLSVSGQGNWEEAEDKLGTAFETLAIAAKKSGVKPDGAPLVQYVESDDSGFSFVVMLPIDKPAKAAKLPKSVKADVSPSGPALRFSPSSTAEDLEEVYARIDDYIVANGLTLTTMVEEYGEDAIASPEDRVVVDIYVFVE